jgi:hypothetical protein
MLSGFSGLSCARLRLPQPDFPFYIALSPAIRDIRGPAFIAAG